MSQHNGSFIGLSLVSGNSLTLIKISKLAQIDKMILNTEFQYFTIAEKFWEL
jgi:hypothetical protein